MKILMISDYFPPEIGSASFLFYELAKEFTKKDVEVSVITGFPRYHIDREKLGAHYKKKFIIREKIEGVEVFRIRVPDLPRKINLLRGMNQFLAAFFYFLRGVFLKSYDYILVYSPPLPLGVTSWLLGKIKKKKTIFNVQDLFPKSAIDLKALNNKYLIGFFNKLEKFVYVKNNCITVHSEGNKQHVVKATNNKANVKIMPNWVNTEEIKPGNKTNEFSREYNLANKFVVSFAGVLGVSQDLDIILDSAKVLKKYKNIIFIIVGDGRQKKKIEKRKREENIDNLRILPMQPKNKYPLVLNSSDTGVVTLKKTVKSPVVPSKILSLMAAGVPIVASLPLAGDAPEIIHNSGSGICVEAEDSKKFAESIVKLYNNRRLRKDLSIQGRKFAEAEFSLDKCTEKYLELFKSI